MTSAATLIQPSGELWKKIRLEINEDVNTREQYLAIIKDWLKKQPHLPSEWGKHFITVTLFTFIIIMQCFINKFILVV